MQEANDLKFLRLDTMEGSYARTVILPKVCYAHFKLLHFQN